MRITLDSETMTLQENVDWELRQSDDTFGNLHLLLTTQSSLLF